MEFCRLLREAGLHKRGRGFYCLRRTFRTVADGRMEAVAERVRAWLGLSEAEGHGRSEAEGLGAVVGWDNG